MLLLARIYEVFPLRYPLCGADMRIIAFVTEAAAVRDILIHLGEPITPSTIGPARGPPLWEMVGDSRGPCTILRQEIGLTPTVGPEYSKMRRI
jgi:hypothetical protein